MSKYDFYILIANCNEEKIKITKYINTWTVHFMFFFVNLESHVFYARKNFLFEI